MPMPRCSGGFGVILLNETGSIAQGLFLNIDANDACSFECLYWVISDQAAIGKQHHVISISMHP